MRFSTQGSMAMAMAASLVSASAPAPVSERHLLDLDLPKDLGKPISANVDIGVDLSDTTLVAGVLAGVAVPPVLGVGAGVEVAVVCDTCYTKGNINASISLDKVVPALKLSLTDIEAKLDLDIKIGAAATIAVNLFTPPAPISLPLPGLKVDALVSLDLVIGVETEIDLSAGIDVKLVDEAVIETDILAGKILDAAFSGLSVQVLPIEVRIGCTKLLADLRLRVELGVAADLDLGDVLPILPDIGAGLEVAVFANLLEYIGFFCATPTCPLSKESYGLNIGAAVELDVAVEDLLSIHLAPTLSTALLSYPTSTICEHPSYTSSVPTLTATTSSATATSSATSSGTQSATSSGTGSETSSATSSGSGSGSATATSTGSGSTTGTATSTGSGSITGTSSSGPTTTSAPGGGVITSTITNTQTFTVTQCAATVPNCPAGYQTTATVVHTTVYTTVCPATQTEAITAPPKPTHTKPATPVTVTKQVVTLVPCSEVSTFTPPANVPTAPYPTGGKAVPSTSVPVGAPSTYPAGSPSATYPAGGPSASYPAGSPSGSYPAGVPSSYPAGSPSVYPTGGVPTSPAYPTVVPPYPTGPAGGSNNTVTYSTPETLSTYVPSASSFYPSSSGYPTAPVETPIPTAGASKVGSGVAGVLAIVGVFVALM